MEDQHEKFSADLMKLATFLSFVFWGFAALGFASFLYAVFAIVSYFMGGGL